MCKIFRIAIYISRVPIESPIHVLNADMFATLSTMFELPSYADNLAHLLAEAPSLLLVALALSTN